MKILNKYLPILILFFCIVSCNREWDNPFDEKIKTSKGNFTDPRDGQKYKWVKIGEQTWMAENLRFRFSDYTLAPASISKDQMMPESIIVYQTSDGKSGKMQILANEFDLHIKWITYNYNGSMFSFGENAVIEAESSFDLDNGLIGTQNAKSDFRWSQNSLIPVNNSVFSVYRSSRDFDAIKVNNGIYLYDNSPDNFTNYGLLYNWYTANTPGICPPGWRLSSDDDWKELEIFLGMDPAVANGLDFRGDVAGKLKDVGIAQWSDQNLDPINSSGFAARPAGIIVNYDSPYPYNSHGLGNLAFFWCEGRGGTSYFRALVSSENWVYRNQENKAIAMSIRCIKANP
jgi:uncharacterized protein (TIGR02145 family)